MMSGARLVSRHATLLAIVVALSPALIPADAAIVVTGDTDPVYTGADPWDAEGSLTIGFDAAGSLTINAGSVVQDTYGTLGRETGSNGTAVVTGPGSAWNHAGLFGTGGLYVGDYGTGTLSIENGGAVSSDGGSIAGGTGANGTVTVTGAGSAWNSTDDLTVAGRGTGTLNIQSGGMVSNIDGTIGSSDGSSGTVTVTGTGSTWDVTGSLTVGRQGTGILNITGGGAVQVRQLTIVREYDSGDGSIHLDNGTLDTGELRAAGSDLTGAGVINTSTLLSDVDLTFDAGTGLNAQAVLNSLPGQSITINVHASASAYEGTTGAGYKGTGSLTITDGLTVSSQQGRLGYYPSSDGTATITGAGSAWNNAGDLYVGRDGQGTLLIESGGSVSNATAYLDSTSGQTSTATVTGSDSAWHIAGELYIGQEGTGRLTIEDGGTVNVAYNTVAGREAPGTGEIHFNQGTLNTGGLLASPEELPGVGTINTAGLVSDVNLRFDTGTGYQTQVILNSLPGQDITINVDAGASSDAILLGAGNRGVGTLAIADGLAIASAYGVLGYYAGSSGTAEIDGVGTAWNCGADMLVGLAGGGTLNIANGAYVSSVYGIVGSDAGSIGTATVTGAGSSWDNSEDLVVGLAGAGTLNVTNGAAVSSGRALIGSEAPSAGTVNVIGAGSTWVNSLPMVVAMYGNGTLHVTQGGSVSAFSGVVASESGSVGTVTVHGDGSIWNNSFNLAVGGAGTGTLNIVGGADVSNTSGFIGQSVGGTGGVTVAGAGSTWVSSDTLEVGTFGAGTLTIQDGATVSVGDGLILGKRSGAAGAINLIGGTLDLNGTSLTRGAGAAAFSFVGGTLRGAATIDLAQAFSQGGGTLAPGESIGQTDILSDYDLNTGTLEIELGGAGDPIDLVSVTGDVDIGATGTTLNLRALGPMTAGTYTLLESTGGIVTGMFESISPFNLFGVNVSVLNTGTAITVTLDVNLVLADPNLDGFVGITDLNIVLSNWNQNVTPGDVSLGDLDGDGFVGINDLNAVLGNWNAGTPPPGSADISAIVPEPAAVCAMLVGLMGVTSRRRSAP